MQLSGIVLASAPWRGEHPLCIPASLRKRISLLRFAVVAAALAASSPCRSQPHSVSAHVLPPQQPRFAFARSCVHEQENRPAADSAGRGLEPRHEPIRDRGPGVVA